MCPCSPGARRSAHPLGTAAAVGSRRGCQCRKKLVLKIVKDQKTVSDLLQNVKDLLKWLKDDRSGLFSGTQNLRNIRKDKRAEALTLLKQLEIKERYAIQVVSGKWSLEHAVSQSGSSFLRTFDVGGGPRMHKVKGTPFVLSQRLPGSFETGR